MVDNGTFDWSRNPKLRPWAEKAGIKPSGMSPEFLRRHGF